MVDTITNWRTFVQANRAFFDANCGCPMFQLIEAMDELYRLVYRVPPFPETGRKEEEDVLHMCFLVCHRSLLSAATSVGSGMAEDGPAITRRAIEAAKTALAIKIAPENLNVWKSIELRKARWENRLKNERPKTLKLEFRGTSADPLYEELQVVFGALSDFSVHFTPEHLGRYQWEQTPKPNGTTERSVGLDQDAVAKELLMMVGQHRLILRVFNRCLNDRLFETPELKRLAERTINLYKDLLRKEGFTLEADSLKENW